MSRVIEHGATIELHQVAVISKDTRQAQGGEDRELMYVVNVGTSVQHIVCPLLRLLLVSSSHSCKDCTDHNERRLRLETEDDRKQTT